MKIAYKYMYNMIIIYMNNEDTKFMKKFYCTIVLIR